MKKFLCGFILLFFAFGSCKFRQFDNKVTSYSNPKVLRGLKESTTTYIGFVNRYYFQKTNEFFVDLYFKNNDTDNDKYEKLSKIGDSIIYKDDENCRTRIPIQIASKEFDLSGLDTLFLYDIDNNLLTKATFLRTEFLDQNIAPVFTAVYKAENEELVDKAIYCIGNLKSKISPINFKSFNDSLLTNDISQKMKISAKFYFEGIHYSKKDESEIISIINADTLALIVEKGDANYHPLYKSHENEYIKNLVVIPIIRNGRPILLTKSVRPETDVEWNSLLIFDGNSYQTSDRQRIVN